MEEVKQNGGTPPGPSIGDQQLSKTEIEMITQSFAGKCCPLGLIGLSMAATQTQGALVSPLGQKVNSGGELVGCQGPGCMWFRIIKAPPEKPGQNPSVVGGDCVVPMTLGAISALPGNMGNVLAQLGKLRFTPNGG